MKAQKKRDLELKSYLETKKNEKDKHEKALFDFDEEIDDLDKVDNRYPSVIAERPPKSKVPPQFQVKRVERPAFLDNKIIQDIEKKK